MAIQNKLDELMKKYRQCLLYHESLRKTHDRCVKAANKAGTICGRRRATLVGRKIIAKSRRNVAEATAIYNEWKRIRKGETE